MQCCPVPSHPPARPGKSGGRCGRRKVVVWGRGMCGVGGCWARRTNMSTGPASDACTGDSECRVQRLPRPRQVKRRPPAKTAWCQRARRTFMPPCAVRSCRAPFRAKMSPSAQKNPRVRCWRLYSVALKPGMEGCWSSVHHAQKTTKWRRSTARAHAP